MCVECEAPGIGRNRLGFMIRAENGVKYPVFRLGRKTSVLVHSFSTGVIGVRNIIVVGVRRKNF